MYSNSGKIIKVFTVILTIIISVLVVYVLYLNKSRFYSPETVRYSRITIDEKNDINDLISSFNDTRTKEKFVSEIKKVNNLNNLDNASVYGKTLLVPVIKN
jgi:cell division protein FtsL